ncbi:hypothetical protein ACK8HX_04585 [Oryzobacter sp. R7]|uniref:hypothetical protein n=1 Tax=Oryzobacter faecalis TaxID=3388656 RepID=UPI00398D26B3
MSAPPGWHLQDDGRERYWDGQQWTEQFRAPAGTDPTAPPPPPSWAGGDGTSSPSDTQAMDVGSTQQLPTVPPAAAETPAAVPYGTPDPSAYPAAHPPAGTTQTGYGSPGYGGGAYGGGGYGATGDTGWQPPQKSGGSGLLKGCLIAVVVGIVVLVGVVLAGIFFFNRAVEDVRDTFPTTFPSDLPTTFPSDLPTEGLGRTFEITVGQGFEVPRARIQDGWALDEQGALGVDAVQVRDMRAEISDGDVPVFFTMSFPTADGGTAETVCTSQSAEAGGGTVDVQCVPIFGDVGDARQGTVTTAF